MKETHKIAKKEKKKNNNMMKTLKRIQSFIEECQLDRW